MPDTNLPAGACEKKQNQVRMFQWRQDRDIWRLKCADGACAAMVYERPDRMWVAAIEIPMCPAGATGIQFLRANSATAKADIDQWFREAARVADECSISASVAEAAPVPCFVVKDAEGRDHVYETPAVACRFRIASDGSLRDVVDMDGNPVEIRKAVEA